MQRLQLELRWAIIFSLVYLGWMLLERLTGLHGPRIEHHASFTVLFGFVAIAVYVVALRDIRARKFDGHMPWMDGFLSGLLMTIMIAALNPIAQWLTHNVVSPDFLANVHQYSTAADLLTEAEADEYFNLSNYIMQGFLGALITGVVTAAVVAFFLKPRD